MSKPLDFSVHSFAGGLLSSTLDARSDLERYYISARTINNLFVMRSGGAANRSGFEHLGDVKDSTKLTVAREWLFDDDDRYILEAGNTYIRFWQDGGRIVTSGTAAWVAGKYYVVGDLVVVANVEYYCKQSHVSHTPPDAGYWYALTVISTSPQSSIYELQTPYVATATANPMREARMQQSADVTWIAHPSYAPYELKRYGATNWTLLPANFAPPIEGPGGIDSSGAGTGLTDYYKVTSVKKDTEEESLPGHIGMVFLSTADITNAGGGGNLQVTSAGNGSLLAVNDDVLVTDVFALSGTPDPAFEAALEGVVFNISAKTADTFDLQGTAGAVAPAGYRLTCVALIGDVKFMGINTPTGSDILLQMNGAGVHGFSTADEVLILKVQYSSGAPQPAFIEALEGKHFTVTVINTTDLKLDGTAGIPYSGGYDIYLVGTVVSEIHSDTADVTVFWSPVNGASHYYVYKKSNGVFGYIATVSQSPTSLGSVVYIDEGSPGKTAGFGADTSDTPPKFFNPFNATDKFPGVVGMHDQRLVFGATNDKPSDFWLSRPGDFLNFTHSSPFKDDDAINGTIIGAQELRHFLDLDQLIVISNSGIYFMEGDADGTLAPGNVRAKRRGSVGGTAVQPLTIDDSVLFVASRSGTVRDFRLDAVEFQKGRDLTTFAPSLVDGFDITQWCYQRVPHSILWAVRNDGRLLGLTYVREQEIAAWTTHDTGQNDTTGSDAGFESVATIPDGDEDSVYAVVNRTHNPVYEYGAKYEPPVGTRIWGLGYIRPNNHAFKALCNDTGLSTIPSTANVSGGNPANVKITSQGSSSGDHGGHGLVDGDVIVCTHVWVANADGFAGVTVGGALTQGVTPNGLFSSLMIGITFTVTAATTGTFELAGTDTITVPANHRCVFMRHGITATTPAYSGPTISAGANSSGHGSPAYGVYSTHNNNKALSGGNGANIRIATTTPPAVASWIRILDVTPSSGPADPDFEALLENNDYLVSAISAGAWFEITKTSGIVVPANQQATYVLRGTLPNWPGTLGTAVFDKALSGGAGGGESLEEAVSDIFLPVVVDIEKLLPAGITAWTDTDVVVPFSVPFPDGAVAETGGRPALALTVAPLRWQARTLQLWPSGFVKWAQVHATVTTDVTSSLTIPATAGTGVSTGANIISLSAGTYTITTLSVTATVKTGAFNLFDTILVGVQSIVATGTSNGVVGTMADGTTPLVVRTNATGAIEVNGPAYGVLRIDGELASSAAPTVTVARFSCRFTASYHSPDIKVTFTLKNDKYHLNAAPPTNDNVHMQLGWVELETKIIAGGSRRAICCNPGTETNQALGGAGPTDVYCYQMFNTSATTDTTGASTGNYKPHILKAAELGLTDCSTNPNYPAAAKYDMYQCSVAGKIGGASGKTIVAGQYYMATAANAGGTEAAVGTNWRVQDTIFTQLGWAKYDNAALVNTPAIGSYPQHGYMNLSGALAGCTIGIRHMPFFWPASLGVNDNGTLRVGVFSRYNPDTYVIPWRMHESRETVFSFHAGASGIPGVAPPLQVAKRLDYPATARLDDYSKYDVAGVFPYQLATIAQEQILFDELGITHTVAVSNESMQVVRFRNASNTGGENNHAAGEERLIDEYLRHGNGGQYFRGVDFGVYLAEWAIPRSADFAHTGAPAPSNPGLTHTAATFDDDNNHQHTYDENVLDAYFLTGDERLRAALIDEADVLSSATYGVDENERGNYQYFRAASLVAQFLDDQNPTEAATLKAALKARLSAHSAQLIDVDAVSVGAGWDSATPGTGTRGYFASSLINLPDKVPGENFCARGFVSSRLGPIAFKLAKQYLTESDADGVKARGRGLDLAKFTKNETLRVATGGSIPAGMLNEKCLIYSYQITLQIPGADTVAHPGGFEHPNEHTVCTAAAEGWRESGNAAYIQMGIDHILSYVSDGHVDVLDSGLEMQDFVRAWMQLHGNDPGAIGVDPGIPGGIGGGGGGGGGSGGGSNVNILVTSNVTPAANQRVLIMDVTKTAGATQEYFEAQLEANSYVATKVIPGVSFELKNTFGIAVPPNQIVDFTLVDGDINFYSAQLSTAELLAELQDADSLGALACVHVSHQDQVSGGGSGAGQIGLDDVLDTHLPVDQYNGIINQCAEIGLALGTYGKPVMLHIMGECNVGHGYHRQNFAGAFQESWTRIRAACNLVGSFNKVAVAWNTNPNPLDPEGLQWPLWYPGNNYVDWCGIDVFNAALGFYPGTAGANSIEAFFEFVKGRNKPVYIPEAAPVGTQMPDILPDFDNGGESDNLARDSAAHAWSVWFGPYIAWIKAHPIIKGIRLLEWDFIGTAYDQPPLFWKQGRIAVNKFLLEMWLNEVRDGTWIGSDQLSLLKSWRTNMGLSAEPDTGGTVTRTVERMRPRKAGEAGDYDERLDSFFVDAGATWDGRNIVSVHPEWFSVADGGTGAGTITLTLSGGTTYDAHTYATLTANFSLFAAGSVDTVGYRLVDPVTGEETECFITAYTSDTVVTIEFQQDCAPALSSGTAATSWTKMLSSIIGLSRLEGRILNVLADGEAQPTVAVANATIVLQRPFGIIQYGLPAVAEIETLDLDVPDGKIAGKMVRPVEVTAIVHNTRGALFGPSDGGVLVPMRETPVLESDPVALFSGKATCKMRGSSKLKSSIIIRQTDPLPMLVEGLYPRAEV